VTTLSFHGVCPEAFAAQEFCIAMYQLHEDRLEQTLFGFGSVILARVRHRIDPQRNPVVRATPATVF
jgi:hypothetical protein